MGTSGGKCIIICAPSGAGKTTLVKHLLDVFPDLRFSISATSRQLRSGETEGKDYYFITPEEFRKGIDEGDFLEWEEVYPQKYYGTLKKEIERIWREGKHVVFDVDVLGGINLKSYFGENSLAVFVKPPSLRVLEERLRKRGTESDDDLKRRLDKAEFEMGYAESFDRVLVNDDLTKTKREIEEWVKNFLRQ